MGFSIVFDKDLVLNSVLHLISGIGLFISKFGFYGDDDPELGILSIIVFFNVETWWVYDLIKNFFISLS